jgi:DNA-binding LytR/AlgR family response regulator
MNFPEPELSCKRLVDGKVVKNADENVPISRIIIIDSIDITKNDRRLRVRTINGDYVFNMFGALSVMEDMYAKFGFWRADVSNLINMMHVDKVVEYFHSAKAVFKQTEVRGIVAKSKIKVLKELYPNVPLIWA